MIIVEPKKTGEVTMAGYAIFRHENKWCCCSGMEYLAYGDSCYQEDSVEVYESINKDQAIAMYIASIPKGEYDELPGSKCIM